MHVEEHPHSFGLDEAVARLKALTDHWSRYGAETVWRGNCGEISGKILGVKFYGAFIVEEHRIYLTRVKVSRLGYRLGGRRYVLRKIQEYFDPAVPLEQLRGGRPNP
jgi:hypothetical protein